MFICIIYFPTSIDSHLWTERGQLLDIQPLETLLGEVGLAGGGRVEFVRVHGHLLLGNFFSDRN